MPQSAPTSPLFTGLFRDQATGAVKLYYKGTLLQAWNASTSTVPSGVTTNFDGPVDIDNTFNLQGATASPQVAVQVVRLGTYAAVASNGADAILPDIGWVIPTQYTNGVQIVGAHRANISASDVTKGTGTSSASYRRMNLITNTAGTGSGTDIVCSLNATASAASNATRAFTTVASTVPAGALVLCSHLTVGAATADGTDMAAGILQVEYQIL